MTTTTAQRGQLESASIVRLRACRACRDGYLKSKMGFGVLFLAYKRILTCHHPYIELDQHNHHHEEERDREPNSRFGASQRSKALPLDHYNQNR